jgi:AcrR family transcriptional regulator
MGQARMSSNDSPRRLARQRRRPAGPVGEVAGIQRSRMISALIEVSGERGATGVTVAHIVDRSGVSRRTFYELFADREACFLAAFDLAVERAAERVIPPFRADGPWNERIREALRALLEFLEDEPGMGRLLLVDALGAGSAALVRRAAVVESLVSAVYEGRREAKAGAGTTRVTAEGVVCAVLGVLHTRLVQDGATATAGLLGALMAIIVLPYQGQARAKRESSRRAPPRRRAARAGGHPLQDLDMRLTYRTVRVLLAIAGQPGASNREVAAAADVSDQGQISKLLARLEHLELIRNEGVGAERGGPNAWTLTSRGEQIERVIQRQTGPTA